MSTKQEPTYLGYSKLDTYSTSTTIPDPEFLNHIKETDKGKKNDADKVRWELLSVPAIREIAKVMTFGAKKYDAHNWRGGFDWSRLYGAALRHLTSHMEGDSIDSESGLSHLAHAGCCIMFLLEHEIRKLGNDDRYKTNT
jgi:hypothetical protein